MTDALRGSCLCGQVCFEIMGRTSEIGQCHCSKCRKVSGTDGNAVLYASTKSFKWLGGLENIKTFVVGDSGWKSSFCGTCGSPVPHSDADEKIYFVPAGLLDDDPGHRGYAAHIFVDSKAPWVEISDSAPQFSAGFDGGGGK